MKRLVLIAVVLQLAAGGLLDSILAASGQGGQTFPAGSFENPRQCSGCHQDIFQAWSRSMHARAWEDRWFQADYQLAHEETGGATDMLCGTCHAPAAARTGQLPPHDGSRFDSTSRQGIFCDFCHTVSAIEQLHNMGLASSPGPTKRGPRGDGRSLHHEVEYSPVHTSAEFCGSCHNVIHPISGVTIIDTYDDWKNNGYGQRNIRCQDCHMTPTPGIGKNPGRAAGMGIRRENVAFHAFTGGSSYLQDFFGHEEQARMARETLRAAAVLKLSDQVGTEGMLELAVEVHNVGAGHKIPTGVSYIRKMWLQVRVLDEAGNQVYSSGHLDSDNHVDRNAVFFRLLFLDQNGNLTGKSWRATGIGYDRRIPANGMEREVYRIQLPARGNYAVSTRLMYRSFSQETMDQLQRNSDEALPPLENVEMAKASILVKY